MTRVHKSPHLSEDPTSSTSMSSRKEAIPASSSSLSLSGKDKASRDSFFLSYAGKDMEALEAELLVPGQAQSAFNLGYYRALPLEETMDMHVALRGAHPNASALELTTLKRHLHLKEGLEALKKWRQDANGASMDSSSLFSSLPQEEKADIVKEANPTVYHVPCIPCVILCKS
jgi:hypothetical protein